MCNIVKHVPFMRVFFYLDAQVQPSIVEIKNLTSDIEKCPSLCSLSELHSIVNHSVINRQELMC